MNHRWHLAFLLPACALLVACEAETPAPGAATRADPAPQVQAERAESLKTDPLPGPLRAKVEERIAAAATRRDERRRWWNDEQLATDAGLDAAARAALDRVQDEAIARQVDTAKAIQTTRRAFREALRNGDLDAARRHAEERADLVAKQALIQQTLVLDQLEALTPEQRTALMENHARRVAGDLDPRRGQGRRAREQPSD